jgi:DnaJ-class molecular chaperone
MNHYQLLGVPTTARERDIRQAYRQRCREFHPDTTTLSQQEALTMFHQVNEAYAILSHPTKRIRYDQQLMSLRAQQHRADGPTIPPRSSASPVEIQERALSNAEVFALFILGLAFVASLLLVGFVSITRG